MNSSNRIIANTIILYTKIIIDIVISLWTVPLVLRALGQSDYGLYNLVAGVVAMLAFLNSSMTVVTQRYMSVTMGKNDNNQLNNVYNASIRIHIVLGVVLVALLELCTPFLFNGFLNIDEGRTDAAILLYQFMIVSTFFTVLAVPFDATLNAYENMLLFSLIALVESFMKLLLALTLNTIYYDRLVVYGLGIASISILGVLARLIFVNRKYIDIKISFKQKIPKPLYSEMLSYAGWNTFGSVAMIGKNQGIAVVLNLFKGTTINAAYGIANQINGLLSSFTASIQKAISPQLMKHEGAKNRAAMIELSFTLVKMASIIFAFMAVPLLLEMEQVLALWLHSDVPPYTVVFCQLIIVMQLIFQLSSGVALAIDAVGNIKAYRIVLSSVLILNIPFAYIILRSGCPVYYVLMSMIVIEILCMVVRLYFAHALTSFPIISYLKECLFPILVTVLISFSSGVIIKIIIPLSFIRIIIITVLTIMITGIGCFYMVLNGKEKATVKSFIVILQNRIHSTKK